MSRLETTSIPGTALLIQYRMHPDIAHCVSRLFYINQLINHPSLNHRLADVLLTTYILRLAPRCAGRQSVFLSIPPCSLYQPFGGSSKINPAHLWLKDLGAQDSDIGVFSTYAARLRLHRRMLSLGPDENIPNNS